MSEIGAAPPFGTNFDQTAAQIVRDIYVHRQKHFIAATATFNGSSSLAAEAVVMPHHATLTAKVSITEVSADTVAHDASNPPAVAEFLLRVCATSKHQEAALGDMNERFAQDCADRGMRRARLLYWAGTLRSLFPLATRLVGRALKWAAVMDAIRRHFLS